MKIEGVEAELRDDTVSDETKKRLISLKREYEEEYEGVFLVLYL